jgi:sec-independent protein translocase protein TatC
MRQELSELDPPPADAPRLTLAEHLEELRRRLGAALLSLLAGVGVASCFIEPMLDWLKRPAGERLARFAYFSPTEPLVAYVKVAVLAGLALAMPLILWQAWAFIRAGLTREERRAGGVFVWWGTAQFLAGAAFAYAVILPASLRLLLGIGSASLEPVISIDRYLSFVTAVLFWCGLVFELPVLLLLLAKVGLVTPEWLRQSRPYAVLILVILAAVVTPTTDPVTLLLLTAPLAGLYELSIVFTRVVGRPPHAGGSRR